MKYNEYREKANYIRTEKELADFIETVENDFEHVSAKQYCDLRRLAIDIYYASLED